MDLLFWLLGFRVVERDHRHVVVRVPWWARGEKLQAQWIEILQRDAELRDRPPLRVSTGATLIRFDGEIRDTRRIKLRPFERGMA